MFLFTARCLVLLPAIDKQNEMKTADKVYDGGEIDFCDVMHRLTALQCASMNDYSRHFENVY